MASAILKADDTIMTILRDAQLNDTGLVLSGSLLRKDYIIVDKFLTTAGLKWSRKDKQHIYTSPAAKAKLALLLGHGEIRDDKKHWQQFYTPPAVARKLVEYAGITPGAYVLEPSAGTGRIVEAIQAAGAHPYFIEIDPENVKELVQAGYRGEQGDFTTLERSIDYDAVVMNPPFTNNQDIDHVMKALSWVRPGGSLVAVMSPGFTFGKIRKRIDFKQFVADHGDILEELPAGTFAEAGTDVRSVVVRLHQSW